MLGPDGETPPLLPGTKIESSAGESHINSVVKITLGILFLIPLF